MPRVIHFEFAADDPERAVKFYKTVFGWKIELWPGQPYWLVTTGPDNQPGINGGITQRQGSLAPVVNTVDVPSLEEFSQKIVQNGGKVITPTMPIPGIGYFANCQDTEGNVFGILQADPAAKMP